jgi:TonB-linked SusC/RagA family outer membrane protein
MINQTTMYSHTAIYNGKEKIYYQHLRSFCLFLCLIGSIGFASAQQTVSGTVTSDDGEVLPGVNVTVKGKNQGVVADFDGVYEISVENSDTLVFTYIGYSPKEELVGKRATIDVALQPSSEELDEVVIMAYGTQKKRDVIGSISKVKADELGSNTMSGGSFVEGLQGKAAGLQVVSGGGAPGSDVQVKVRGISSISSGSDPLFVVDGIVGIGISGINPNDIASIEVLKDASATAIYGARGSNGVIIVTTKTATSLEPQFNLSITGGISNWTNKDLGLADTNTYFQIADQGYTNSGQVFDVQTEVLAPRWVNNTPITRAEAIATNNNFADLLSQTGSFQDISLSSAKRTENSNMYASVWYRNDTGNLLNSDYSQLTGRLNLTFNKGALEYGVRLFGKTSDRNFINSWGGSTAAPWIIINDPNNPSGYWNGQTGNNPLANADSDLRRDNDKNINITGSVFAKLNIKAIEGLSIRTEYSPSFTDFHNIDWTSRLIRPGGANLGNMGTESKNTGRNELFNVYTSFDRDFGKHNINLVLGHERQSQSTHRTMVGGDNLVGNFQEVNFPGSNVQAQSFLDPLSEAKRISYFSRLNYKFNDRYLLGASYTREGYSQFRPDNRWGNFYSVSAGWILSDDFFEDSETVSLLKLRGSYGQTGNGNIPGGITDSRFTLNTGTRLYAEKPSLHVSVIGNSEVTWEKLNNLDVGIDYGLFNDRINGSLAYYRQDILSLLLQVTLPASAGLPNVNGDFGNNSIWGNVGDMVNDGIEFDINGLVIDKPDFKWRTGFNFTTNKNKVTSISPEIDATGDGIREVLTFTRKGLPIGTYYMSEYAGVDPQKGIPLIQEVNLERVADEGIYEFTGNTIPATENNARKHKIPIGDKSALPKWYGGFNNTITYKNLDFGFDIYFQGGNYIYNRFRMGATGAGGGGSALIADILENSWKQPGDIAQYPQLAAGRYNYDDEGNPGAAQLFIGNTGYNTRFLEKGDFIRLRSVSLGYTIPQRIASKMLMDSARIYMSGTNLITKTSFNGYDPEMTLSGGSNFRGIEFNGAQLPQSRIISIGLDIKF